MSKRLSWCQKVCQDVKNWSWSQKHVMTSKSYKYVVIKSKTRGFHQVKNISWRQKVHYDVKKTSWLQRFVSMSKVSWWQKVCHYFKKCFHDVTKFVMTSEGLSWRKKICQMFVMKSKIRHVKKFVMMSKVCHEDASRPESCLVIHWLWYTAQWNQMTLILPFNAKVKCHEINWKTIYDLLYPPYEVRTGDTMV